MLRCSDECDLSCYAPMCLGESPQPPPSCYSGCSATQSCGVPDASGLAELGVAADCPSWMMAPPNGNCSVSGLSDPWGDVSSLGLPGTGFHGLEPRAQFGPTRLESEGSLMPSMENLQGFLPCETDPMELGLPSVDDIGLFGDDELCKGLHVDPENAEFNFENSEQILSFPQANLEHTLMDEGMNGLFMKNLELTNLNGQFGNTVEASSLGQNDQLPYNLSHIVGVAGALQALNSNGDQIVNQNAFNNLKTGFPTGGFFQNTFLGECNVSDPQEHGVSSLFRCESSRDSNRESIHLQARKEAKIRYNEKKRRRSFGKQVRYASRKVRADTRKRMKGRFVKAGDAGDSE